MITYQVKITVEQAIEAEWLQWMKTAHVPDVIGTGLVKSFHILKPESEGSMYLFHYQFDTKADYDNYQDNFAPKLKAHPAQKYPNQFSAEREIFQWV